MTVVAEKLSAPVEQEAGAELPAGFLHAVDAGLLVTLSSRMHCRAPMKLVDPDAMPLHQPVNVTDAHVIPVGAGSLSAGVDTYRCTCGFTIDVPAANLHALAS